MKQLAFISFTIFLLCLKSLVYSQNVASCDSNEFNFNDIVNFDTTAMSCQLVWKEESYTLRYAQAGAELWSFLLSAPDRRTWIGIGYSKDGQMIGASAMVGWFYPNGTGTIQQYYLQGKDPSKVIVDQGELTVVVNSTIIFKQANSLFMAFQLSTPQPQKELLYAIGPNSGLPSQGFLLTEHHNMISTTLNYQTGQSQAEKSPYTGLRRTHGALNMIGWGILMPIGAIVARYFRQWDPIWFYSHTAIQIFSFLFGLVGFILGFVLEGLIHADVTHHKNIGITILTLACVQVMALLLRPQKGSKLRKYWNLYHHNAGRVLVILAISNIFYGIRLGMEGASWYGTYAVMVAILFTASIALEIRLRRQR